ncbi:DUF4261 domain-containing protein [Blastopirellula sp. JC732]|uniref:DUF4261 domain-containing protein n=1 Tax=Blastopirellula sediminis TaxID=2894196 RepID=A0A9X1MMR3_9BACT|nr:DUF4261 domain-containing protein [Blastopirellula sediminis]MCC9608476.1 DUF4261 domain-containing protein [Blastopirellula sediminis]MCC9628747.1 DUF4261 domain-containing protein [Blastopirellula sediminis]
MALAISMVLFPDQPQLSIEAIQQELATRWPELPAASDVTGEDNTYIFDLGEAQVIVALMPAPFPWSDLEGPCATSILWKDAAEQLKTHQTHAIVSLNAELDPIPHSTMLTKVVTAVLAASPSSLGVYWGNATLIVPKAIFLDFATEVMSDGPPLHIWVDFRVGAESSNTSSGFTCGMAALGHMELEANGATEPPRELYDRLMSLAGYVLENGPVIRDGDTVGQDANEKIRVIYGKSNFGHEGKVMRLVYESGASEKPWWKFW